MPDQSPPSTLDLQKQIASKCNDAAWDLIEQPNLEPTDIAQLLTLSATARHHWYEVGTTKNVAHADLLFAWALARAGVSKAADLLARVAMSHFEKNGATWERAFAHAAMAAACQVDGDTWLQKTSCESRATRCAAFWARREILLCSFRHTRNY